MNAFPLAPFLTSLAADGMRVTLHDYQRITLTLRTVGPWNLTRLRGVLLALLVREVEQEEMFLKRFDNFFHTIPAEAAFPQLDLDQALQDLQTVAERSAIARRSQPFKERLQESGAKRDSPQSRVSSWIASVRTFISSRVDRVISWTTKQSTEKQPVQTPQDAVQDMILQIPQDMLPHLDLDAPRHFRLGAIGGQPVPRLDATTLDQLADSLGYFRSEQPSHVLDVPASIEATGRNGGMPALVYHKRKQLRSVLVLEDQFAEALA